MPLYEYQCQSCGTVSEVMQRMSDPPLTTCEECSGDLKKLISAPAFQFKGTGWYVTDYADKKGDSGDKGSDKGSDSSSSKSGDSDSKGSSDKKGSSDSKDSGSSSSDSSSKSESKSKPEKAASKD